MAGRAGARPSYCVESGVAQRVVFSPSYWKRGYDILLSAIEGKLCIGERDLLASTEADEFVDYMASVAATRPLLRG